MRIPVLALSLALTLGWISAADSFTADEQAFRDHRAVEILGPGGWASLVDLHWVTPGTYTIGKAASNAIALPAPSAPDRIGTLTVTADSAMIALEPGVAATLKGQPVTGPTKLPGGDAPTSLTVGKVQIVTIRRGDRFGLRVWDEASATRQAIHELQWMPIDKAWRIDATFTPHDPAPRVPIVNVIGETIQLQNPGDVTFTVKGQTYHLEALLESPNAKELFFMFRDGTSNKTTYGAGRYLYTDLPKDGHVILDFNRAKNPPCAFTNFATCPLPPASNRLTLPIPAGELNDGHHQ